MAADLMLPSGYTYSQMITDFRNERTVHVKEITNEEAAKAWVNQLSEITLVTWRTSRTYVTTGSRVFFKKLFRCQHSQIRRNRPVKKSPRKARSSKNTNCEAELLITVRRITKDSKINPRDLALLKEFPTVITFKRDHNHDLTSSSVLKYRPLSKEVKDKMYHLFKTGYLPLDALRVHKMDLQMEHRECYSNVADDGHLMPSVSDTYRLFEQFCKTEEIPVCRRPKKRRKSTNSHSIKASNSDTLINKNGPLPEKDRLFVILQTYLDKFQKDTEGKARFQRTTCGNHYFVVICTSLMMEAHKSIKQSGDLVLVEAWGGSEKQKHRIYLMVTPTAAGSVPLGAIVTDSAKESVFIEGLLCLKDVLGDSGFYSLKQPLAILSDFNEITALQKAFPDSKSLLCQFHVLKAAWSWLCHPTNVVDQNIRHESFVLFRKLLNSEDEATAEKRLWDLILFAEEKNCGRFGHYVSKMYDEKEKWVSCYRQGLPISGSNTTNYVGAVVFRIVKDVIFNKTKAYNLLQLLDFIIIRYENYMRQRLHDFRCGEYSSVLLKNMMPSGSNETSYEITKTDNKFVFNVVESPATVEGHSINVLESRVNVVDLEAGVCSCTVGQSGQLCGHSTAAILKLEKENVDTAYKFFSENITCFFLAEGRPAPGSFGPARKSNENSLPTVAPSSHPQLSARKYDSSRGATEEMDVNTDHLEVIDSCVSDSSCVNKMEKVLNVSPTNGPSFQNEKLQLLWTSFGKRVEKCVKDNPKVFNPALQYFFENLESHCKTNEELGTALYSFSTSLGKRKLAPK